MLNFWKGSKKTTGTSQTTKQTQCNTCKQNITDNEYTIQYEQVMQTPPKKTTKQRNSQKEPAAGEKEHGSKSSGFEDCDDESVEISRAPESYWNVNKCHYDDEGDMKSESYDDQVYDIYNKRIQSENTVMDSESETTSECPVIYRTRTVNIINCAHAVEKVQIFESVSPKAFSSDSTTWVDGQSYIIIYE